MKLTIKSINYHRNGVGGAPFHAGEDFHLALAQACRHYVHELNDQQHDERRLIP